LVDLDFKRVFKLNAGKTELFFGVGSVSFLSKYLKGVKSVGVIASKKASRVSGALSDVLEVLKGHEVIVVDGPAPNPTLSEIKEITSYFDRRRIDALVAIGGGSVIDAAKIVSVSVSLGLKPELVVRGEARFEERELLPLYAVNLTHGTGSEVDPYSVVNLPEAKLKIGLSVRYPTASFDDPSYTLSMPKRQIVCTSIDALYHSLESVTTEATSPFTLTVAEDSARLIFEHLPRAVERPEELTHRYWLLYASVLGGLAIDHSGVNIIHAVEHGLSAVNRNLEHGCGLGIIGPEFIKHLYREKPRNLYRLLKHLKPDLTPSPDSAEAAAKALREFQESVGLKESLSSHGFDKSSIEEAVKSAWVIVDSRREIYTPAVSREMVAEILTSLL